VASASAAKTSLIGFLTSLPKSENMLSETDQKIALEFKRRLLAIMPVRDLRAYGSRARGDDTGDSDLDIFVEVETVSREQRERIYEIAWEVGFEMGRVISTFVATVDQLENGPLAANPIMLKIEDEGVRL
jgi:predicted nucleotidyltransferase